MIDTLKLDIHLLVWRVRRVVLLTRAPRARFLSPENPTKISSNYVVLIIITRYLHVDYSRATMAVRVALSSYGWSLGAAVTTAVCLERAPHRRS